MKLIAVAVLCLFQFSCETKNKSSELEKENAELKLRKENIELKNQLRNIEDEEQRAKSAAFELQEEALYQAWKKREMKKIEDVLTGDKAGWDSLEQAKTRRRLTNIEETQLLANKFGKKNSMDALQSIMNDEFRNRWYQERLQGIDLKLSN